MNNKGFTLIELMVVVAIIAILATIAGPSYQGFQGKARQKEAQALLNGYFQSAQASFSELGYYPGNFVASGFSPVGELGYRLTAADFGTDPTYGVNDNNCVDTNADCNCGTSCATFKTWTEKTGGNSANGVFGPVAPGTTAATASGTFTAVASGVITANGGRDEWVVNERKALTNPDDGLN